MVVEHGRALVLDAGAVTGLARAQRSLRARVEAAWEAGADICIPMVVIAETVRGNGPRDARVNLVLAECAPYQVLDEATARLAGALLAQARSNATVDALVIAEALRRSPSVVLTADPTDLTALLGARPGVIIEAI